MPTLAHIYIRTPQGRATAFNALASMNPSLKSLLKAVDGKMTSTGLATHFAHLGSVEKLLLQLESAGLIADRGTAFAKVQAARKPDGEWRAAANPLVQISMPGGKHIADLPDESPQSSFAISVVGEWRTTTGSDLEEQVSSTPEPLLDRMVAQVVDWMSTFVLTYMPQKAFTELGTIEKIRTPAQLIADLPRYEAVVKPLGPTGALHIEELNQLVQKLFASAEVAGHQV
jgi:hypothetical protein